MTVSEPVLDSFDRHSNDLASKHSGADANACSRTNTALTTAPLYELVWSKQKGLSYISASSSSADKKASLLWSTGTCNIMVSPSNVNYGGDRSDGGDREHDLSSPQSGSHMEDKAYKVTLVHCLGNACGTSGDMGEIKEKDDKFSEEKPEEDKYNEKIHYCPLPNNEFQFHDAKPELVFIQEFNSDSCAALMTENRYIIPKSLWIARFSDGVFSGSPKAVSHTNNPDSKLQLTLSSKCCKISEPMTSTFSTRLDALIHTTPLKNVEEYARANKFCLFCGKGDHSIRECSEVVETSLEHYLNTMPLYDRIKKATCFCILCFHLGHWAASCPNVSSKGNGFGDDNSESTTEKHRNHHFANHGRAIKLFSGSKKDLQQVENKDSDFVVSPKLSKNESARQGILDLHMNRVEDATIMDKMKAASSFSSQNEATRSELNPFCNHLSTKTASGSEGIFVFIRKLRLSRTDIIRWMKSSTRIDLTGFFLRLRIEKLEKGLGGTGYYVAHVNGESNQSSIFVCVGSSTYTVTTRFISNQDFNDDELNTWWFQKLRDGSQLPSREELNEKLQLRRKFGI